MKVFSSVCCHDCGGCCPLNIYVEDGKIVKIEGRDVGLPAMQACDRGLLYHYRVYAEDRLKYPLKRSGERGEGKFVRITWDQALDEIAMQITRIRDTYGPASILNIAWQGADARLHHNSSLTRFLNMVGGQTRIWGGTSNTAGHFTSWATYGAPLTGSYRADFLNSKMIIIWGCNPAEPTFGTETRWYLGQAKDKGIRIVCIDPRFTESAATWASTWIAIRPGTDAAMMIAMAYVILEKGLQQQSFLDKYTYGFDKFRDYVTGAEDGVAKTPEWAEKISGVPAATIRNLAIEFATTRPAALLTGYAPGRTSRGEQFHRNAVTLSAMTGNIGIQGGSSGCMDRNPRAVPVKGKLQFPTDGLKMYSDFPTGENPVEMSAPLHEDTVKGVREFPNTQVHVSKLWDAVLNGKSGGYQSDIRMIYVMGSDCINQFADTNSAVKAFKKVDFVVVHEQFVTPTARYADIVLPVTTWCERNDIKTMPGHYAFYAHKAIEPLYESKNDMDIFIELAAKMGISGYNDKTEEEWLKIIAAKWGIPDYYAFKEKGFYSFKTPTPFVAYEQQITDPEHYPFPTPTGKIEIYCQRLADFSRGEELPPIPKYIEGWEGVNDPKRDQYPLQLITTHSWRRNHSMFHNIPWFRQQEPHEVWINPSDAVVRNIRDKDQVKVFNDRGAISIQAKVTDRIMSGVVSIYQGTWFDPDKSGVDRGGCVNVLTRPEHSPGGAFCSNTALVQIEKAQEDT